MNAPLAVQQGAGRLLKTPSNHPLCLIRKVRDEALSDEQFAALYRD